MMKKILNNAVVVALLIAGSFLVTHAQSTEDNLLPDESIFDNLSVDVKVNGSDGPVEIVGGGKIVISWESEDAKRCKGNWSKNDLPWNGKAAGTLRRSFAGSITVRFACIDSDGNRENDFVALTIAGASISSSNAAPSFCYTFTRDFGETNITENEFSALGSAMFKEGLYPTSTLHRDDIATVIVDFQAKYGIKKTSTLDPATRAKLNGMYGCGAQD